MKLGKLQKVKQQRENGFTDEVNKDIFDELPMEVQESKTYRKKTTLIKNKSEEGIKMREFR